MYKILHKLTHLTPTDTVMLGLVSLIVSLFNLIEGFAIPVLLIIGFILICQLISMYNYGRE